VLANERMLEIPAEDAAASAEVQLLRAILTLQQDDGDVTNALDALDRAADLESESPGFLRRAATIAMSNPETLIESRRYIERLGRIEPQQADLLLLRYDLERLAEPSAADLLPRARELSSQSPKLSVVWNLYLDILTRAFGEAVASGRFADADLLADEVKAAAAGFVARFPGQPGPMRREAAVYLSLGDPETSALKARAALDMVQGVPEVSDVILFARAAILAGQSDRALDSLRKFKGEIIENPGRRPIARRLLFRSLLASGETAEAYEVYSSMAFDQDDVRNWVDWIELIEVIPVEAALKASRLVLEGRTDPSITLTVAAALGQSYQENGDARLAAEAKRILAIRAASESDLETAVGLELTPLQIQIMRLEVLASFDEIDPITEALVIIRGLDDQYLDQIFSSEPGRNLAEDRLAAQRIPVLSLLNNYVARSAEALLDGAIPAEARENVLGTGRRAADLLGRYAKGSAEILDSRAMFMLAIGDLEAARDLIDEAVDIRPDRAEFYYTQGVILLAMGDGPGATRSADRATGCLRYLPQSNPALEQKIRELKEQARDVDVSLQLDLRDSTSFRFTTVFGRDLIETTRPRERFL
jgi:tetratricopeptide (TPR) repeat protein